MTKYTVHEEVPVTFTYTVEAESGYDAIRIVSELDISEADQYYNWYEVKYSVVSPWRQQGE